VEPGVLWMGCRPEKSGPFQRGRRFGPSQAFAIVGPVVALPLLATFIALDLVELIKGPVQFPKQFLLSHPPCVQFDRHLLRKAALLFSLSN
jgi:hypothetical protein